MLSDKYLQSLIKAERKSKSQLNDEDYIKHKKFKYSEGNAEVIG